MVTSQRLYLCVLLGALLLSGCGKPEAPGPMAGPEAPKSEPRVKATQVVADLTGLTPTDESWWGHEGPDGSPVGGAGKTEAETRVETAIAGGIAKKAITLLPPRKTGRTFQAFVVQLPQRAAALRFETGIPDQPGIKSSGTVSYSVRVIESQLGDQLVWDSRYGKQAWELMDVDLSTYAGRKVTIRLVNTWDDRSMGYAGPACWARPEILGP